MIGDLGSFEQYWVGVDSIWISLWNSIGVIKRHVTCTLMAMSWSLRLSVGSFFGDRHGRFVGGGGRRRG